MIAVLVWLIIVVAIFAIAYWAISKMPLPPIANTVAVALLAIVALVIIAKIGAPPGL